MRKAFARLVLRLARWRTVGDIPSSGILVGAPHTSNWDWVAMWLLMWSGGVPPRVLIKAEIMRTPLGPLLRANGGISLDRQNPGAVVRDLVAEARSGEPFLLIIAAEGTRKKVDHWKSGFYRIARQNWLPISMGFIDGPTRTLGFGPSFSPTGDVVADMDVVRAFYADKHGSTLGCAPNLTSRRRTLSSGESANPDPYAAHVTAGPRNHPAYRRVPQT